MKLTALLAIILTLIGLSHCGDEYYDTAFCIRLHRFACDKATKSCSKERICKILTKGYFLNLKDCQKKC